MTEFPETRSTLLAQVRSPDEREAWEEFVLTYQPAIYRMARRRGMQDSDAQDLVQTVLMRVAGAIESWQKEPGVRFRHWLRRVAKNAILSAFSRQPKDLAFGGSAVQQLMQEQPAAASEVEQELVLESQREQFLRASVSVQSDVNAETWRAFELTVIEGESCESAAKILEKSVGTVYAARSRVMRRLRNKVRELEQGES